MLQSTHLGNEISSGVGEGVVLGGRSVKAHKFGIFTGGGGGGGGSIFLYPGEWDRGVLEKISCVGEYGYFLEVTNVINS